MTNRYQDGADNDPKYWPLDYPPLSGFQVRVPAALQALALLLVVSVFTEAPHETSSCDRVLGVNVKLSNLGRRPCWVSGACFLLL